jgi:hypothetical protein
MRSWLSIFSKGLSNVTIREGEQAKRKKQRKTETDTKKGSREGINKEE